MSIRVEKYMLPFALVFFYYFLMLFWENFVLSSSLDLLTLREVDDVAFQTTIARVHDGILHFKLNQVIQCYDYAYGWLFWMICSIITLPVKFLVNLGIDWPLIVLPRQLSLLANVGGLYYSHKIFSLFSKDKISPLLAILLMMSFPQMAMTSLRFGTVGLTFFFCALTTYHVLSMEEVNKKNIKKTAILMAACAGIKINSLLLAPFLGLIILDKLNWSWTKETFQLLRYGFFYFIGFGILFANPALYLSFIYPKLAVNYYNAMANQLGKVSSSVTIERESFVQLMQTSLNIGFLGLYTSLIFLIGSIVYVIKKSSFLTKTSFVFLIFLVGFLLSTIHIGPTYINIYFYSFIFIIPLIFMTNYKKFYTPLFLVFLLFCNVVENRKGFIHEATLYSERLKEPRIIAIIDGVEIMKKVVGPLSNYPKGINYMVDYRVPFAYSHLRSNISARYLFDNISEINDPADFDFVVTSFEEPGLMSEADFKNKIDKASPEWASTYTKSRKIWQNLIHTGRYKGKKYKEVLRTNELIMFQLISQ